MTRFEFGVSGSADRAAWDAAGGGAADVVAAPLRSLGYANVFTAPPAASLCAEPRYAPGGRDGVLRRPARCRGDGARG